MPLDFDHALSWKRAREAGHPGAAAELAMLHDLQGNILKGHGRHFTSNLFLWFDPGQAARARTFLAAFADQVTTALDQLIAADAYKGGGAGGGNFFAIMLSASGYDALDMAAAKPSGSAFLDGMKNRPALNDPGVTTWHTPFQGDVHAMILVAGETAEARDAARDLLASQIAATGGAVVLLNPAFQEDGNALFNKNGHGIEHFGYVDGRSQPLALVEQLEEERDQHGGITHWNPEIPLGQLVTPCPGGALEVSCGSYFVFRKLEQDVHGFKAREEALEIQFKERFHLREEEIHERLGATVVGRFENGTPTTVFGTPQPVRPGPIGVPNDFNFAADPLGLRCPFAGHIRKTNPRSDTPDSIAHLMARRGIPYGTRRGVEHNVLVDDSDRPAGNVGLLFMAYQSSLERQFEVTQVQWANDPGFVKPETGIDPLIGQPDGAARTASGQRWPATYGISQSDGRDADAFSGFVTMRGGEYFFAPSISFLRRLTT